MMDAMSKKEFERFRSLVYERLGISLSDQKVSLLQSRLGKLARTKGMREYGELYDYFLSHGGQEADHELEDAVTTNVTSFFREAQQWVYLKEYLQNLRESRVRKLRIWSAACSTGEEPYSIAMFLKEHLPDAREWDIRILATDISEEVLKKAMRGVYSDKAVEGVSKAMLGRYFITHKKNGVKEYEIDPALRQMVMFRKFNLVYGDYSMFANPLDIVFCRNVMIYFDKATQRQIDTRLGSLLRPGGLLLIGHSESIPPGVGGLRLVRSSIYMKE